MAELLLPDTFDRLRICADQIRNRADECDEAEEVRGIAQAALRDIVPELKGWEGSRLDVYTDTAFYKAGSGDAGLSAVKGEPFELVAPFERPSLMELISQLGGDVGVSDVELCLRFQPRVETEEVDLRMARTVLIPVMALHDVRPAA